MPTIELRVSVALPAVLLGPEILAILRLIERGEAPYANFSIGADLRDLHLPGVGQLSIPVEVHAGPARGSSVPNIDLDFHAKEAGAIFPTFKGSIRTDAEGPSNTTVWMIGEYTPPLGLAGAVLDRTLLKDVAARTLMPFLETIAHAAEAAVRRREVASARDERFNR